MRTTLTIDEDVAVMLKRRTQESGQPFRTVVNEALRRGLHAATSSATVHLPSPRPMGQPTVDLTQALSLADDLNGD